jgi:cytochrome c-type biogenesis protein CcmH/NrfG
MAWLGLAQEYRAAGPAAAEVRLQALRQAEGLLPGAPARGRMLAEEAEALLDLDRLAEAEAAARRALRVHGDLLLPRSVLAAVAERRGDWPQAREQLQTLLDRLPPDDPRAPGVRQRLATAERGLRGPAAP